MKSIIIILILLIIFILGLLFFNNPVTGKTIDSTEFKDYHTFTKAICNSSNYCQDHEIVCNGDKLLEVKPIVGAVIQNPQDWQDSRINSEINCSS